MLLVINTTVAGGHMQGRNEDGQGGAIPRARKSPNNVTCTFLNTVQLLPKDLRFEHGGARFASCPGRHQTWHSECWFQSVILNVILVNQRVVHSDNQRSFMKRSLTYVPYSFD